MIIKSATINLRADVKGVLEDFMKGDDICVELIDDENHYKSAVNMAETYRVIAKRNYPEIVVTRSGNTVFLHKKIKKG